MKEGGKKVVGRRAELPAGLYPTGLLFSKDSFGEITQMVHQVRTRNRQGKALLVLRMDSFW